MISRVGSSGLSFLDVQNTLSDFFSKISAQRIIAIVPDSSRDKSFAPEILRICYELLQSRLKKIVIALGTHRPMTQQQIASFYDGVPLNLFLNHDWKNSVTTLGTIKKDDVHAVTGSPWASDFPVQINAELLAGYDLILSIGQVLPHEVAGMANHSKNILIGTGGAAAIGVSHFIGAVCDMEKIMGIADTPVRRLFNYGMKTFASSVSVSYIQTVCTVTENHKARLQGLFAGDEYAVFEEAAALSSRVNVTNVEKAASTVVARTDESTFWLSNKAIYRSRMMIADGGTLIVMAPNLKCCAEDPSLEDLIRKIGYRGTESVLESMTVGSQNAGNLAANAHLIHGSSEGRFSVIYAVLPEMMDLVRSVGYQAMDLAQAQKLFGSVDVEGWAVDIDGHEFYHLPFPASGLWKTKRSIP